MKVIAAIGHNGSGKDEVLRYLKARYGVPFFSTGDMVREIAAKEGVAPTRENLHSISEKYFREHGEGCFVRLLVERIKEEGIHLVGISGIRSLADVRILKEAFGEGLVLINVAVENPRLRYERLVKRGEERDPRSYEEFLEQEKGEEALFRISEAAMEADYTINNDGSRGDLHAAIDRLVKDSNILQQ